MTEAIEPLPPGRETLRPMRRMFLLIGLALAAGCGLLPAADGWAADGWGGDVGPADKASPGGTIPSVTFPQAITLDGQALEHLRVTNPNHYARAERILAAANYLCRPRVPDVYLASFGAQDLSCRPMMLLTSNPPQWRIGFRLDETRYVATVFVTDDPPHRVAAR